MLAARLAGGGAQLVERRVDEGMVAFARRGQSAVLAIHQHHAQPVFQRAQVAADDGVADTQRGGGAAHPAVAAKRLERAQGGKGRQVGTVWHGDGNLWSPPG
jgi:hypothetical protein